MDRRFPLVRKRPRGLGRHVPTCENRVHAINLGRSRHLSLKGQLVVAALLIIGAAAGTAYTLSFHGTPQETRLTGSLFISDAGQSHGGFEYTASYNVSLSARGSEGRMTLALDVGLGDVLTAHEFTVSSFQRTGDAVTMVLNGQRVVLPWTAIDHVWGHAYDGNYIASWGSASPAEEIRGTIGPDAFPGVLPGYYVELRLA